jgi:uncharacterized protein (DUF2147 family)
VGVILLTIFVYVQKSIYLCTKITQTVYFMIKKLLFTLICALMAVCNTYAQDFNNKADNIVGEYLTDRGGKKSKVRITKNAQGTYDAQVFWVEQPYDENGKKRKDVKNPDKSLRNVDIDNVVIVKGLKYDAEDKIWSGAKIYDPTKGMHFKTEAEFVSANKLKLCAIVMGFKAQTIYWQKIK